MSRLLLVRHGITEFNSAQKFAGYSDVELSVTGYRQVERLRDRLVDDKIDAVYSSDLRRALVTAEVLSLSRVETYPQGAIVSLLNDTAHLRGVDESD